MTASGSVSDFDDTTKTSIGSSIAAVVGVDASAVTIAITAASVLITATIAVPASTTAAAVQATLFSTLGTAAAASTVLGIIVESIPAIAIAAPLPDAAARMPPPPARRPVLDTIGGSNIETSRDGDGGAIALVSCAIAVAVAGVAGGLLFLRHRRRRRRPLERSLGTSGGVVPKGIVERSLSLNTVQMAGVCAIEHDVYMTTPADLGEEKPGAAGASSTVCARAIEVLEVRAGDAGVLEAAVVSATAHKRHAAARLQRWWRRRRTRSKTDPDRLMGFSRSSRAGASPIVRVHHSHNLGAQLGDRVHHSHAAIAELSVVPLPLVDATARVVDPRDPRFRTDRKWTAQTHE